MGGEYTVRGYELRTIGPRDENGYIIGGTSSLLFNFEYMFLITPEIRIVPFVDAGNAYNGKINFRDLYYSAGVEMRFFVPVMNIPFRFIFAHPINPEDYHSTSAFHFTVGTNF
jgi:outer membrane translocation and assembly module TamA